MDVMNMQKVHSLTLLQKFSLMKYHCFHENYPRFENIDANKVTQVTCFHIRI